MSLPGQSPSGAGLDAANMQAMFPGGQSDNLLQTQELVNPRAFERVRGVLLEAQLNAFGKYQTNQLQTLRVGMSMAKRMFASESGTPRSNQ